MWLANQPSYSPSCAPKGLPSGSNRDRATRQLGRKGRDTMMREIIQPVVLNISNMVKDRKYHFVTHDKEIVLNRYLANRL